MLPASRCRHKTIADTFNYINTITFSQYFDIPWKLFISGSSTCMYIFIYMLPVFASRSPYNTCHFHFPSLSTTTKN